MTRRRRSPLRKALRAMAPHRVLWRAFSGPEVMSAVRSKTATRTTKVTAATRQAEVARAQRKAAAPAKKTAAKKTNAGKRGSTVYEQAKVIPGQNRAAAAKTTQPAGRKRAAPMRDRVLRNADGTLAGSTPAFTEADAATNTAAWQRRVDPALRPRNLRGRPL